MQHNVISSCHVDGILRSCFHYSIACSIRSAAVMGFPDSICQRLSTTLQAASASSPSLASCLSAGIVNLPTFTSRNHGTTSTGYKTIPRGVKDFTGSHHVSAMSRYFALHKGYCSLLPHFWKPSIHKKRPTTWQPNFIAILHFEQSIWAL